MKGKSARGDLITALERLNPAELDAVLAEARRRVTGPSNTRAALRLSNTGGAVLRVYAGSGHTWTIEAGASIEIAADEVVWPRSDGSGLAVDRAGFTHVPRGLLSLRILPASESASEELGLGVDLAAWHAHAARYGVPYGFARGAYALPRKGKARATAGWLPLASLTVKLGFYDQDQPVEILVVGLGIDLSGMSAHLIRPADLRGNGSPSRGSDEEQEEKK